MKVKWVLSDREEYFVNLRREQFIAVKIDQKTEHDKSEQQWGAVSSSPQIFLVCGDSNIS